jgi:hypothetical protein
MRIQWTLCIISVILVGFLGCGGEQLASNVVAPTVVVEPALATSEPERVAAAAPPPLAPTATLVGAGDISQCGLGGSSLTAALVERLLAQTRGTGVTFGDNSNDDGSRDKVLNCFDKTWGPLKGNLFPSPGNHDYEADGSNPFYYDYFGGAAGPRNLGYYSYDRGAWHILALNSELPEAARQAQLDWMDADLRAHPTQCSLAYFHRPLFSSGIFAAQRMKKLWDVLYRHGVDVILNGHEHFYAAFPLLDPGGGPDPQFGIRQIIAGTVGARLFDRPFPKYGETMVAGTWGALSIELAAARYKWDFVSVDGIVLDSGNGSCHAAPPR